MADDLEDSIRDNAKAPAKASGDAGSVEQHNLKDQIEADKYLASKRATKSKNRGMRFNKVVPPRATNQNAFTNENNRMRWSAAYGVSHSVSRQVEIPD